jgi:hypothetical protein
MMRLFSAAAGQAFTTSLNGTQQGHKPGVVSADYRDWCEKRLLFSPF